MAHSSSHINHGSGEWEGVCRADGAALRTNTLRRVTTKALTGSWPLHVFCSISLDTQESPVASGLASHHVLGKDHDSLWGDERPRGPDGRGEGRRCWPGKLGRGLQTKSWQVLPTFSAANSRFAGPWVHFWSPRHWLMHGCSRDPSYKGPTWVKPTPPRMFTSSAQVWTRGTANAQPRGLLGK